MLFERRSRSLRFAVRPRVLVKFLGQLSLLLAAFSLAPLLAAFLEGDPWTTSRYLVVMAVLLLLGWPASRTASTSDLQRNEAMVIVVLVFLILSLIMTGKLSFPSGVASVVGGPGCRGARRSVHERSEGDHRAAVRPVPAGDRRSRGGDPDTRPPGRDGSVWAIAIATTSSPPWWRKRWISAG